MHRDERVVALPEPKKSDFLQPNQHSRRETDRLLKSPEPMAAGSAWRGLSFDAICDCTADVQDTVIARH